MNKLIYLLFVSIFLLDWLALKLGLIPRVLTWLPELLSLAAIFLVSILIAVRRPITLSTKYLIFFSLFFIVMLGGIVINGVSEGVILAGLRIYLKYVPFFLLPLVYTFSDQQINRQLKFLLTLSLLQFPVTVYQRLIKYEVGRTGDLIGGTLGASTSGTLSIYLSCVIALVVAFYLKGKISRWVLIILLAFLVIPMTLNETTISLLVLPFALFSPVIFVPGIREKVKNFFPILILTMVALMTFLQVYDHFRASRSKPNLLEWATPDNVTQYLSGRGTQSIGRFKSIDLAIKYLNEEDNLLMGVGIGNASPSVSEKLTGSYHKKYWQAEPTKVYLTRVLWEMGIIGVLLYIYFFSIVFFDAVYLRKHSDTVGAISLGWISVVIIIAGSFVYLKTFDANIFGYLFWYFSGYIASRRYTL